MALMKALVVGDYSRLSRVKESLLLQNYSLLGDRMRRALALIFGTKGLGNGLLQGLLLLPHLDRGLIRDKGGCRRVVTGITTYDFE